MYCPNVRSMPLGPGPNLMMFVAPVYRQTARSGTVLPEVACIPNMKPMIKPTAAAERVND